MRSPISVTRSKQGLTEGGGNCSNVSKTIEKKGLEGGIGNRTNVPKTICNPGFEERGVATCENQFKTADIGKRNPAWMMHAEKNFQDCEAPPLPCGDCTPSTPGGDLSGLNPPVLSTDKNMTGATTNMLRRGNPHKLHSRQEDQGPQ